MIFVLTTIQSNMANHPDRTKPLHVVAISSYAVHGTASLKTFIKILGSSILPVPSLMLSGLTNITGIKKFEMPLEELLESTLELVVQRGQEVIFYTGYLAHARQADIVASAIKRYRSSIRAVLTDPVCGDHGKVYVSTDVIHKWPEIISLSDFVFPNLTELRLITGNSADAAEPVAHYIQRFKEIYPSVNLMISSYAANNHETGIQLHQGNSVFEYYLSLLPENFGGSGDLLLALFIRNHFYADLSVENALKLAVNQTYQVIKFSITSGSNELLLHESIYNQVS